MFSQLPSIQNVTVLAERQKSCQKRLTSNDHVISSIASLSSFCADNQAMWTFTRAPAICVWHRSKIVSILQKRKTIVILRVTDVSFSRWKLCYISVDESLSRKGRSALGLLQGRVNISKWSGQWNTTSKPHDKSNHTRNSFIKCELLFSHRVVNWVS